MQSSRPIPNIFYSPTNKAWVLQRKIDGKIRTIGHYQTQEQAAAIKKKLGKNSK